VPGVREGEAGEETDLVLPVPAQEAGGSRVECDAGRETAGRVGEWGVGER
jgi:hypothetical protein